MSLKYNTISRATMKTSQRDIIQRILREEKKVDNFRCIDERITTRLSDIIFRLKKEGWEFNSHFSIIGNKKNFIYELVTDPDWVRKQKQQEEYEYYRNKK